MGDMGVVRYNLSVVDVSLRVQAQRDFYVVKPVGANGQRLIRAEILFRGPEFVELSQY